MIADAVSDLFPTGRIEVVGRGDFSNVAVLWRRVNNMWEAINLNDVISCGGEEWANVSHAFDINDCGWIVGHGTLTDGSPRGFILVPADACPGDISGDLVMYPDGKVDINDLTTVILNWGVDNCIADVAPIGGDNTVNIDDLTAVILSWCSYCDGCTGLPCSTCCPPPYNCPEGGGNSAMAGGGDDTAGDSDQASGQMTLAYLLSLVADQPHIIQAILESDIPGLIPAN